MNTHRAVIERSVPPGMTLIAAGDEAHCEEHLRGWLFRNSPDEYETAYVLEIVKTITPSNIA